MLGVGRLNDVRFSWFKRSAQDNRLEYSLGCTGFIIFVIIRA